MKIKFAGKDIELKSLSLNDWIKMEEMGCDVKVFAKGEPPSFKQMRSMIYIALNKVDDSITEEYVGDNIDPIGDKELFNNIINFIAAKETQAKKTT